MFQKIFFPAHQVAKQSLLRQTANYVNLEPKIGRKESFNYHLRAAPRSVRHPIRPSRRAFPNRHTYIDGRPMEKIVFLDKGALRGQLGTPNFPHEWVDYTFSHTEPEGVLLDRLKDATIVISNRTPITANIVAGCKKLKLVAVAATGYDIVDVKACTAHGIPVCNVQNWAVSLAEHVFALALALRRQLLEYRQAIRDGGWASASATSYVLHPVPLALHGSTLGLIGYGGLAKRVEKIARAFDMSVMIAERRGASELRPGRSSFEDVVKKSDVLVLLCPLNSDTRHLIGAEQLSSMKKDSILINCARGGVVDEDALASALTNHEIAGAGIDVVAEEPPVNGSPLLDLDLPNLIVTSHVAWASTASIQEMLRQLIGNLEAFVRGEPRNLVS